MRRERAADARFHRPFKVLLEAPGSPRAAADDNWLGILQLRVRSACLYNAMRHLCGDEAEMPTIQADQYRMKVSNIDAALLAPI